LIHLTICSPSFLLAQLVVCNVAAVKVIVSFSWLSAFPDGHDYRGNTQQKPIGQL